MNNKVQFEIKKNNFYINGKQEPLLCGEIQYFRMPKESWARALDRLAECGCNAVAYYVPWFVHEYEEGKFDFTGKIHPDNDLHTWIQLTMERGLLGFLRPGPYVYAETRDLGIPRWFSEKYPDARVKRYKDGRYEDTDFANSVARNHPQFLGAVEKWYREVCREIRDYQAPGGNIVLFQLCNEIPGDDHDDENPVNLGLGNPEGMWPKFLKDTYQTLKALNSRYHGNFTCWEQIRPHELREADGEAYRQDHLSYYYGTYFPGYFRRLRDMAEENGIHVQMVHNAYNPRAVSLHYQNKIQNPWLLIGTDCYYSMSGRLGMKEATYYCEYGPEYTRRFLHNIPWVVEQECGYWNDFPLVYGPELYIWNIWTMACGYQGMSMYLFGGGINRPGMGFYGTEHNWQGPVDAWGNPGMTYDYVKKSLEDILENKKIFLGELCYDIGFGIRHAPGLIWRPVAKACSEAYFVLKSAGFTPRMYDYEAMTAEELREIPVLWIVTDEYMEERVQGNLAAYVRQGGKLVVNGRVPHGTSEGKTCTLLAEALGIRVEQAAFSEAFQRRLVLEGREYFIGTNVQSVKIFGVPGQEGVEAQGQVTGGSEEPGLAASGEFCRVGEPGAVQTLAVTEEGEPAALLAECGEGRCLVLPFGMEMSFWGLAEAVRRLLETLQVQPGIRGARMLRVIPKADGHVIVMNLHPVKIKEEITIFMEGGEKKIVPEMEPHSFRIW